MRDLLKEKIEEYMKDNELTTYSVRKMQQNGEENPLGGVGISTINKIRLEPDYIPSRVTIKKLLNLLNIEYKESYNGIELTNEEDNIKAI